MSTRFSIYLSISLCFYLSIRLTLSDSLTVYYIYIYTCIWLSTFVYVSHFMFICLTTFFLSMSVSRLSIPDDASICLIVSLIFYLFTFYSVSSPALVRPTFLFYLSHRLCRWCWGSVHRHDGHLFSPLPTLCHQSSHMSWWDALNNNQAQWWQ